MSVENLYKPLYPCSIRLSVELSGTTILVNSWTVNMEFSKEEGGLMIHFISFHYISPQLFNEYVKDLGNHLNKSLGVTLGNQIISHLFFADDLIIISDSPEGLQKQLDLLHSYNQKWHLIASIEKTKEMIFNKKFVKKCTQFKLGD